MQTWPAHGTTQWHHRLPTFSITEMRQPRIYVYVLIALTTQMADAGVAAATDFDWASQMRFYWRGDDESGHLKVKIHVSVEYHILAG